MDGFITGDKYSCLAEQFAIEFDQHDERHIEEVIAKFGRQSFGLRQ